MPKRQKLKNESYSIEVGNLSGKQIAAYQREEKQARSKNVALAKKDPRRTKGYWN